MCHLMFALCSLCKYTHRVCVFKCEKPRRDVCACAAVPIHLDLAGSQPTDQAIMIYIVYLVFVYTLTHSSASVQFKKKKNAHENRMWKMRRFEMFKYVVFSERPTKLHVLVCRRRRQCTQDAGNAHGFT